MYKFILFIILIFTTRKGATQYLDCGVIDSSCYKEEPYPSGFPIEIEKKWETLEAVNIFLTTMVYTDADCESNLVQMTRDREDLKENKLFLFDPKNGEVKRSFNFNYQFVDWIANNMIICDVDKDGNLEFIFAPSNSFIPSDTITTNLICFNNDGSLRWVSDKRYNTSIRGNLFSSVSVSDFNNDGIPEIYMANKIFNAQTGIMLLDGGNNGLGTTSTENSLAIGSNFDTTNRGLELAAGFTIYDIEINNLNGTSGNTMIPKNITIDGQLLDGYTSAGDINGDGILDAVVVSKVNSTSYVYAYSLIGGVPTLIAKIILPSGALSPPLIVKDESDILPSIIVSGQDGIYALKYNNTLEFDRSWTFSNEPWVYGCTAYDLNNDGFSEIIFRDFTDLNILEIKNGEPVLSASFPCKGDLPRLEIPMVADIDNSGQAKICITCGTYEDAKLVAFGSPDTLPGWTPARGIWNQHNYNVLNINDDGTVPQYMENNATFENGRYNNFYQQATALDSNGMYRQAAASLFGEIQCVNYDAESGQYTVTFDVSNRADASLAAGLDLPISFYDGNPEALGSLLGAYKTTSILNAGDTLKALTFTFAAPSLTQLFMVVNTERATSGTFDTEKDYQTLECDYTDNISQTIDIPQIENIQASICEGDNYDFYGDNILSAGLHYKNLLNDKGCDSLVGVLELSIVDTVQIKTENTTCDSYIWNGETYTQSGNYQYIAQNVLGCDSIVTLDLTIHNSNNLLESSTACDSFIWNGALLTESGSFPFSGQNIFGCDSTATLLLTIKPSHDISQEIMACESYTWNGSTYTDSGIYTYETKNQYGCDSTLTLSLTINDILTTNEIIATCDSLVWNGQTYTQDGTFMYESTTIQGCDSIANLNLTIYQSATTNDQQTVCDSLQWHGNSYNQSGIYTYNTQTAQGCDSLITLDLTIHNDDDITQKINTCEAYTWNSQTYTQTGNYTFQSTNQYGCDSTVTLELTIQDKSEEIIPQTACDTYEWNGNTYSQSGQYPYETTNTFGCDSIAILDLLINFSNTVNLQETACESFEYQGQTLLESGDYTFNLQTATGCDSTVNLSLLLTATSEETTKESCDSFLWNVNNETYTTSGQYTATFTNALGCDSTQIIDLTVHNSYQFMSIEEACESYIWPINTEIITTSGQYTYLLKSAYGCDSIYTLDIIINPDYTLTDTVSTTSEYTWQVNGITYTTSGVYTEQYTTNSQCDSIHLLLLTIDNTAEIYVPNILRPGGDNTYFTIFGNNAIALIQDLSIYDRWGNRVFNVKAIRPNDPTLGWNGKMNGQDVESGVYIWKARLILTNGSIENKAGDITVIK